MVIKNKTFLLELDSRYLVWFKEKKKKQTNLVESIEQKNSETIIGKKALIAS